jgi:hypothetical protein
MILIEDRKPVPDAISTFKKIDETLGMISALLSQLERKLTIIEFSERCLEEGTWADQEFVKKKLEELQPLISDLDKVELIFKWKDI